MKINDIRVIRSAQWLRLDFDGHTVGEFKRADVGGRLRQKIAELRALEIKTRFAAVRQGVAQP